MRTKFSVFLCAVAFALATIAHAADATFVGVLAIAVDDAAATKLGLSDEKREALLRIVETREAEALELALSIKDLPAAEREAKLKPFREESEQLGLALLSAEQRAALAKLKIERAGLTSLGESDVAEKLKLNDEQKSKIAELLAEREKTLARAAASQQRGAKDYYERKLAEVITAEQRTAWEQLAGASGSANDAPREEAKPMDAPAENGADAPAEKGVDTPEVKVAGAESPPPTIARPAAKPSDGKLLFNFRFQPWKDVLDWFAQQADLSLVMDAPPPGTFNYQDDRRYTPAEAIDLLNGVLLTKGFTLVRRDRMLMLVNLADGPVPQNLVPTIAADELASRGKHELVSVVFVVNKLTPDEAEQVVKRLVGPQGSVITLPQARQLVITETAGRLGTIKQVLDTAENPAGLAGREELRTFDLQHTLAPDVLTLAKQLLGIAADKNSTSDNSLRLAVDLPADRILASGKPEMLERAADVIKMLDVPGKGSTGPVTQEQPQLEVYSISAADPTSALQVMQTLMAGLPDVRLAIDPRTGNLIALARPSQHATIRATLDQMQRDAKRVEVLPLRTVDPQTAVIAINKLFGGEGENAAATGPKVEAESTLRQLLVRGSDSQIQQIKSLIDKMEGTDTTTVAGGTPIDKGNVRMIPLTGRQARTALEQLQQIWPATHKNVIRVVTPANAIPEIRGGGAMNAPREGGVSDKLQPGREEAKPVQGAKEVESGKSPADDNTSAKPGKSNSTTQRTSGAVRVRFASQTTENRSEENTEPLTPGPSPARGEGSNAVGDAAKQAVELKPSVPGAPIVVVPGANGIMIASEDKAALDEFEMLLSTLASRQFSGGREFTVFYLKHAKAATVAELLGQIFGGGAGASGGSGGGLVDGLVSRALGDFGGGLVGDLMGLGGGGDSGGSAARGTGGPVEIVPDVRLNALVVQAAPTDLDTIEQLLKVLDQQDSPEEVQLIAKPRLIPVVNTNAETVASVVRSVYQDRLTAPANQQRQPSPEEFFAALRGNRGGRGGSSNQQRQAETQKMTIGVDARSNSLVVTAPDPLFGEVKALVEQLDMPGGEAKQTTRVVTLKSTSPEAVKSALVSILGDQAKTSTAATGANANRASQPGGQSTPRGTQPGVQPQPGSGQFDADRMRRQVEFFNNLQGGGSGRSGFGGGRGGR